MAAGDLQELKPVYLIYGSEELLLERATKRLQDRLAAVADLDFNMEVFDAGTASTDEVVNAANTMPFMSDRRLVIVRDVDRFDAAALDRLASYVRDPSPSTCLVLVAKKIAKNSKLFRAAATTGVTYEYAAPKRSEYADEVVRMFRERGKRISRPGAEALVEIVGRDLRRLDAEADKLVAYAGASEQVTPEDIKNAAAGDATSSVFELADAVGARDIRRALIVLHGLLGAGESALGVHAMLTRHVRGLIGARALADRGLSPDAMAPELGMAPWQARNVARQGGSFTPRELAGALRGLADAELQMKTSSAEAGLVLERWIVATAGEGDRRRRGR